MRKNRSKVFLPLYVVVLIKSEMLTGFNSYKEDDVNRVLSVYLLLSEFLFCRMAVSRAVGLRQALANKRERFNPYSDFMKGLVAQIWVGKQSSPNLRLFFFVWKKSLLNVWHLAKFSELFKDDFTHVSKSEGFGSPSVKFFTLTLKDWVGYDFWCMYHSVFAVAQIQQNEGGLKFLLNRCHFVGPNSLLTHTQTI